jgi:hypothetical protein
MAEMMAIMQSLGQASGVPVLFSAPPPPTPTATPVSIKVRFSLVFACMLAFVPLWMSAFVPFWMSAFVPLFLQVL